jgi:hypothetical protein
LCGFGEFGGDYDDWVYEYLGTKEWESNFGKFIPILGQNALSLPVDIRAHIIDGIDGRLLHATLWGTIPAKFASH